MKGYQSVKVSVKLFETGHPAAQSTEKSAICLLIAGNMATISATTFTSSIGAALKISARVTSPVANGLPTVANKGKVMCSMEKKGSVEANMSTIGTSASFLAAAAMSSPPAMALVDERLSTEGTGLPFGLSNNLLGWILFGVFGLIWALYFVYTSSLDEDDDSGLSL